MLFTLRKNITDRKSDCFVSLTQDLQVQVQFIQQLCHLLNQNIIQNELITDYCWILGRLQYYVIQQTQKTLDFILPTVDCLAQKQNYIGIANYISAFTTLKSKNGIDVQPVIIKFTQQLLQQQSLKENDQKALVYFFQSIVDSFIYIRQHDAQQQIQIFAQIYQKLTSEKLHIQILEQLIRIVVQDMNEQSFNMFIQLVVQIINVSLDSQEIILQCLLIIEQTLSNELVLDQSSQLHNYVIGTIGNLALKFLTNFDDEEFSNLQEEILETFEQLALIAYEEYWKELLQYLIQQNKNIALIYCGKTLLCVNELIEQEEIEYIIQLIQDQQCISQSKQNSIYNYGHSKAIAQISQILVEQKIYDYQDLLINITKQLQEFNNQQQLIKVSQTEALTYSIMIKFQPQQINNMFEMIQSYLQSDDAQIQICAIKLLKFVIQNSSEQSQQQSQYAQQFRQVEEQSLNFFINVLQALSQTTQQSNQFTLEQIQLFTESAQTLNDLLNLSFIQQHSDKLNKLIQIFKQFADFSVQETYHEIFQYSIQIIVTIIKLINLQDVNFVQQILNYLEQIISSQDIRQSDYEFDGEQEKSKIDVIKQSIMSACELIKLYKNKLDINVINKLYQTLQLQEQYVDPSYYTYFYSLYTELLSLNQDYIKNKDGTILDTLCIVLDDDSQTCMMYGEDVIQICNFIQLFIQETSKLNITQQFVEQLRILLKQTIDITQNFTQTYIEDLEEDYDKSKEFQKEVELLMEDVSQTVIQISTTIAKYMNQTQDVQESIQILLELSNQFSQPQNQFQVEIYNSLIVFISIIKQQNQDMFQQIYNQIQKFTEQLCKEQETTDSITLYLLTLYQFSKQDIQLNKLCQNIKLNVQQKIQKNPNVNQQKLLQLIQKLQ